MAKFSKKRNDEEIQDVEQLSLNSTIIDQFPTMDEKINEPEEIVDTPVVNNQPIIKTKKENKQSKQPKLQTLADFLY